VTFGLSDLRIIEPLDYRTFGLSNIRTIEQPPLNVGNDERMGWGVTDGLIDGQTRSVAICFIDAALQLSVPYLLAFFSTASSES